MRAAAGELARGGRCPRRGPGDGFREPPDESGAATCDNGDFEKARYIGEGAAQIALDAGSGSVQEYVEDCQVCCRPWRVAVHYALDGNAEVTVESEDQA